jgi:hypothetical protein
MNLRTLVASSALALSAVAVPASAAIIFNGGFETGPTSPPTPNDWQYNGPGAGRDGTNVHSGSFSADLNNVTEANNANVQEQTPFGSVSAGTTYTLSYWAQGSYGVGGIGQAQVAFMDSGGGILPGYPQFINIPASAGYVQYMQNFTAPANSSALFLAFNSVTGAVQGSTAHVFVDDVNFAPVPEPTAMALFGFGALGLGRRLRARARA